MIKYKLVPVEPTKDQWGGLARAIMLWLDLTPGAKMPRSLLGHLKACSKDAPQWLLDEHEMKNLDHSMSKGTRCVIIYKAMLAAAPEVNPWVSVKERLPKKKNTNHVVLDEGRVDTARFYTESIGFDNQYITHWWDELIMPIPRPKV